MHLEDREKLNQCLAVVEGLASQMEQDTRNSPLVRQKARTQLREMETVWAVLRDIPVKPKPAKDYNGALGAHRNE